VASTIGIGVGYPLAGLLTELGGVRAAYGLGVFVTAVALLTAVRSMPVPPTAGRGDPARLDVPGAEGSVAHGGNFSFGAAEWHIDRG
jgi:hypothetical protein